MILRGGCNFNHFKSLRRACASATPHEAGKQIQAQRRFLDVCHRRLQRHRKLPELPSQGRTPSSPTAFTFTFTLNPAFRGQRASSSSSSSSSRGSRGSSSRGSSSNSSRNGVSAAGRTLPSQGPLQQQQQPSHDIADYQAQVARSAAQPQSPTPRLEPLAQRSSHSVFNRDMVGRLCLGKYQRRWRGQVLMKDSISLSLYTELLQRLAPGTIFDLGTCGGGSALWFADQARALGLATRVLTFDIADLRSAECRALMGESGSSITFVQGNIFEGREVLRQLQESGVSMPHPWLIAEDCHVDAGAVLAMFEDMQEGDYIVFEDTHPLHPDDAGMTAEQLTTYQHGRFADEKRALMAAALQGRDDLLVDASIQDMYGYNGALFINSVFRKSRSA